MDPAMAAASVERGAHPIRMLALLHHSRPRGTNPPEIDTSGWNSGFDSVIDAMHTE
jgi:hypothetical protein